MIAYAFITQRFVDQHQKGLFRQSGRNPPSRRDAEQQATSAGKHLFCDENGERGADGKADDADGFSGKLEVQHFGMVAGPARKRPAAPVGSECPNDVAIGVEDADIGDWQVR